jgi:hypothetical protein
MSTHILVVDDEPDVESMFRQHFRRDLRSGRFIMDFVLSAPVALERIKTRVRCGTGWRSRMAARGAGAATKKSAQNWCFVARSKR